jgi:hypothetical protein
MKRQTRIATNRAVLDLDDRTFRVIGGLLQAVILALGLWIVSGVQSAQVQLAALNANIQGLAHQVAANSAAIDDIAPRSLANDKGR